MTFGQMAYEAYRAHTGGISLASGQPIPNWAALKPAIRAAWETSAEAVRVAAWNLSCMADWHNPSDPDYPESCGECEMRLNKLPDCVRPLVAAATTRKNGSVTIPPGQPLPDREDQNGTKQGVHVPPRASQELMAPWQLAQVLRDMVNTTLYLRSAIPSIASITPSSNSALMASSEIEERALMAGAAALGAEEQLALAAERLLAELGVTEPGAGEDNHETPAATLMDKLYEAWNNYMRARHGQADAIFEPEGE